MSRSEQGADSVSGTEPALSTEPVLYREENACVTITLNQPEKLNALSTELVEGCLLYTSPSPRDLSTSRMPSSA